RGSLGISPFPELVRGLAGRGVGQPPDVVVRAEVVARVAASVVRVEGRACDVVQEGTGFAVAPRLVVTNAHVVAGERVTTVIAAGDRSLRADVVAFDAERDLALLRLPSVLPALVVHRAAADTSGAVL